MRFTDNCSVREYTTWFFCRWLKTKILLPGGGRLSDDSMASVVICRTCLAARTNGLPLVALLAFIVQNGAVEWEPSRHEARFHQSRE